jgi:capsular polysaccharide biosynthesis protein
VTTLRPPVPCVELPRPDGAPPAGRVRVLHAALEVISDVRVTNLPMQADSYENAVALPVVRTPDNRFHGAMYDRTGQLIRASQRARPGPRWRSNPDRIDDQLATDAIHLPGQTFFGGQLNHVFGHVLLETLARFWRPLDYSTYDQVVLYPNIQPERLVVVSDLTRQALELAGVWAERIRVVERRPMRFDHLDVVQSPIRLGRAVDPRLARAFDQIADRVEPMSTLGSDPRVYLSRRRLGEEHRLTTNEDEIEAMMTAEGFVVVHPQELPLRDQVVMARRAKIIAGCDGSALHVAAFARPGTKLLALDSRRTPNQLLLGWARGLDAVHVAALNGKLTDRLESWSADLDRVRDGLELTLASAPSP